MPFATTLCNLASHKIYYVVLDKQEIDLRNYLQQLKNKEHI